MQRAHFKFQFDVPVAFRQPLECVILGLPWFPAHNPEKHPTCTRKAQAHWQAVRYPAEPEQEALAALGQKIGKKKCCFEKNPMPFPHFSSNATVVAFHHQTRHIQVHFEWDDFVRFRELCNINITEARHSMRDASMLTTSSGFIFDEFSIFFLSWEIKRNGCDDQDTESKTWHVWHCTN